MLTVIRLCLMGVRYTGMSSCRELRKSRVIGFERNILKAIILGIGNWELSCKR